MKLKKSVLLLAVGGMLSYFKYRENEKLLDDIVFIDRCRHKLISLGYTINDSYCLNLKQNSYLLFYFTDKDRSYEVKYDKISEKIIYIKGE